MPLPVSPSGGRFRTVALVVAAASFAVASWCAPASAATVSSNGPVVSVRDETGTANDLAITVAGSTVTVVDTRTAPNPGAGCSRSAPDRVTCTVAGLASLSVDAGAGDDTVTVTGTVPATIADGPGDDRMTGGGGDDVFAMGTGADVVSGGAGSDTADYSARTHAVSAKPDGVADDGETGEHDNVGTDVENLLGGNGADSLSGSGTANSLDGGRGADTLSGRGGTDTVTYASRTAPVTVSIDGVANDGSSLDGAANARDNVALDIENLVGGRAGDSLTGSAGVNRLIGGPGADIMRGLDGDDILLANDGEADVELNCDGGAGDSATVDPIDPPSIGCETIK